MRGFYSPTSSTWAAITSLEPQQVWVPRLDCAMVETAKGVPLTEPPLRPRVSDLLSLEPESLVHPNDAGPTLWPRRPWKSHLASTHPDPGFPSSSLLPENAAF